MIKVVPKKWGREEWIVNDEYCGKILFIRKNCCTSIHLHTQKKETLFVLSGEIQLEWALLQDFNKKRRFTHCISLSKGQSFTLFQSIVHKISGIGKNTKVLEVSTHHEESDTTRLKDERI